MKKERQNIMPNEKASEQINSNPLGSSDSDIETSIQRVAKSLCEPTDKLYRRNMELGEDPFAAIESVKLSGIREDEITDPITGLIVGAAKLETARKELDLTPKQAKVFAGLRENIDGAIALAGANKLSKKAINSALIVSLTLSSAGCVSVIPSLVEANSNATATAEAATINPMVTSTNLPPGVWTTPKPTELFTIGPTINPTETITIPEIDVAPYPRTADNFIATPSISGNAAEKRIIELGAGGDLGLLKTMYRQGGLNDTKITFEPVILENNGKVTWNVMARAENGHFLKFIIKSDSKDDQVVRAMGMITFINTKPAFSVEELPNPKGYEDASQKVIWDKNGWSVIGAFEGDKLVAWFNADTQNGGKWETIVVPEDTPTPTETPYVQKMHEFTLTDGTTLEMPEFPDFQTGMVYASQNARLIKDTKDWNMVMAELDAFSSFSHPLIKEYFALLHKISGLKFKSGQPIYTSNGNYFVAWLGQVGDGSVLTFEDDQKIYHTIYMNLPESELEKLANQGIILQ